MSLPDFQARTTAVSPADSSQSPAAQDSVAPITGLRFYTIAFWVLLLAFAVAILTLPLFPSADGGLHIYFATIFRDLLMHQAPLYARFYAIRHLVQPYSLHYYSFLLLRLFLCADAAEKVLVVGVMATLAFGFRSLVRSLSAASPGLVLLIFPFLLNWLLSMGALNYNFAIGMLMFALAAYERFDLPGDAVRKALGFVGLLVLLILSHPVPLLLLAFALGVDLLLRWWQARDTRRFFAQQRLRVLCLALTCVAFLIPILLADKAEVAKSAGDIKLHLSYLRNIFNASRLSMFGFADWRGRIYNKLYFLLLPASFTLVLASGWLGRLRRRAFTGADRLALFSAVCLLGTLFAPETMNGSAFFADRLWLPCWLLGIAACSGALRGPRHNRIAAGYAVALSIFLLVLVQTRLRPIADRCAELERAPLPRGERGLYIQSSNGDRPSLFGMNFTVYNWNGARAFIAHDDVLLNSAWLYLTIIPLKENGTSSLIRDYVDQTATEDPNSLGDYLAAHPDQRARALQTADFLLFVDPAPVPDPMALTRSTLGPELNRWHCQPTDTYALCLRAPGVTSDAP